MQWSFSRLKQYKNCPRQFYEVRVANNFVVKDTAATLYGKALHEAIEKYVVSKTEFPKNYATVLSKVPLILNLIPGLHYAETKMAVDINRKACEFDNPDYWVRGIADLVAVAGDRVAVVDWKSGSDRYADTKQLTLMALLVFANFPQVNTVGGMLYFIKNAHPIFSEDYERADIDDMWETFANDLRNIHISYESNNWPMTPSGLCGYCPVETCPHWKEL